MSTMIIIWTVVGLVYIAGIVLTFRWLAKELDSIRWIILWSLIWPVWLVIFGVGWSCVMLDELRARIRAGKS